MSEWVVQDDLAMAIASVTMPGGCPVPPAASHAWLVSTLVAQRGMARRRCVTATSWGGSSSSVALESCQIARPAERWLRWV